MALPTRVTASQPVHQDGDRKHFHTLVLPLVLIRVPYRVRTGRMRACVQRGRCVVCSRHSGHGGVMGTSRGGYTASWIPDPMYQGRFDGSGKFFSMWSSAQARSSASSIVP